MPSASYSFIDVAVIDGVRERFAAGDALAILSDDLNEVIWANGPGAALFGYPHIEAIMGASARLGAIAKRQIMATSGFPDIGTDRGILVRLATGMTSRAVPFLASALTLPDGARAILLAVPAMQAASRSGAEIAARAISGFNEPGHFAAFVDAQGGIAAAANGFDGLGISGETLAGLVAQVAGEKDRIVKRMIRGKARSFPAGLARLADEPALHLLVVIDESQANQDEAPAEDATVASGTIADATGGQASAEETVAVVAEAVAKASAPGEIVEELAAEGGPDPESVTADSSEADEAEPLTKPAGTSAGSASHLDGWYFTAADSSADADDSTAAPATPTEASADAAETGQPVENISGETMTEQTVDTIAPAIDRAAAPTRFVWRTDAEGRFSAISPEFETTVGQPAADVVGRLFRDVAAAFGLDPSGEISGLLDRRDTWSGRSVLWPVAGTDLKIPVDLAALPVYGRDRGFEGFRGFGVARGADAVIDPEGLGLVLTPSAGGMPQPAADESGDAAPNEKAPSTDPFRGEVPALTIVPKPERRFADKVIRLAEHRPHANDKGLSPVERNAFREIGERLKPALEAKSAVQPPTGGETPAEAVSTVDASADIKAETTADPVLDAAPSDRDAADANACDVEASVSEEINGEQDLPPDTREPEQLSLAITAPINGGAAGDAGTTVEVAPPARSRPTVALLGYVEPEPDLADESLAASGDERQASLDIPTEASAFSSDTPLTEEPVGFESTTEAAGGDEALEAPEQVVTEVADTVSSEAVIVEDAGARPEAGTDGEAPRAEGRDAVDAKGQAEPEPVAQDLSADAAPTLMQVGSGREVETAPVDEAGAPIGGNADKAVEAESEGPPERAIIVAPPIRTEGFLPSAFSMADDRRRRAPADTSILEKLPVPVLIHSGDILHYANPEFLGLTGYGSIDDLADSGGLGALFADPASDAHADGADRELWLRTKGGMEFTIEALLRSVPWAGRKALMLVVRRTGEERPVGEPGPAPSPTVAELAARVAEMRTIIDTATDGVVLIAPDGAIRSISRPAEALFGFDSDEVAGKHFASLFAIESQRAARDYLSGLSEHGVASVLNDGREVIGRESQGRFIPLFMTIGRLPNDSGYCAVVRDITQWKRAEEDLTQARAVAERSSSQKSDFLARVSHEIRTPLNAIIGFSELMVDEKFGPIANDRYRDYLRDINRSGNHVLDIVNDLLDISKIEAGQQEMDYQAVSLNDTLAETVAMMQPQANRERVIIRSSFASRLPEVVADQRSVRQIALNILSNAIRYTQAGGQVIVSTSYEASGDIVMRVRDTGIGMTQAEIEQALKPFKQINSLKRARGDGTGLGLPLTKAMVEANRARFAINSTPGEGTLVEVAFPSTRVLAQ